MKKIIRIFVILTTLFPFFAFAQIERPTQAVTPYTTWEVMAVIILYILIAAIIKVIPSLIYLKATKKNAISRIIFFVAFVNFIIVPLNLYIRIPSHNDIINILFLLLISYFIEAFFLYITNRKYLSLRSSLLLSLVNNLTLSAVLMIMTIADL